MFETCSDQILAKLVNQEVATSLFSSRRPVKIYKMKKISVCLEIAESDIGGGGLNFGSRRTILDIKTHFFKVKPVFWG